jgi:hypothetical protein
MKSLYSFIVKPVGKRYENSVKVGDKELIINTSVETFKAVNNMAEVVSVPLLFDSDIKVGDKVKSLRPLYARDSSYFNSGTEFVIFSLGEESVPCLVEPISKLEVLCSSIDEYTFQLITDTHPPVEDIEKPERYNKKGKLECWDVILDQEMGFLEGNILKYLWRYKSKHGIEDLKKAKVYLEKLIDRESGKC